MEMIYHMILGTLRASLLGNLLTGKGIVRAGTGHRSLNPLLCMKIKNNGIFNTALSFNKF